MKYLLFTIMAVFGSIEHPVTWTISALAMIALYFQLKKDYKEYWDE